MTDQIFPAACREQHTGADGSSRRNCHLWRAYTGTGFPDGSAACGGAHTGAEEKCEEKGEVKQNSYRLTVIPIPHSSCTVQEVGRGVQREVEHSKVGRKGVILMFIFLHPITQISNYFCLHLQ